MKTQDLKYTLATACAVLAAFSVVCIPALGAAALMSLFGFTCLAIGLAI